MTVAFFFYNIGITVAFVLNAVLFGLAARKSGSRTLFWISMMFLTFIVDSLLLYMNEFLPDFSVFYTDLVQNAPFIPNLLGLAIVFCYRMILLSDEGEALKKQEGAFWIALLALYTIATSLYPADFAMAVIAIFRSFLPIFVIAASLIKRIRMKGQAYLIGKGLLFTTLVLQCMEAVERFAQYFDLGMVIPFRYVSVELLSILFSIVGLLYIAKLLSGMVGVYSAVPSVVWRFASLDEICDQYRLTAREREVLELVMQGKSNAEIGEKMFVSEGTVKTHLHNIYAKFDVKNRLQLVHVLNEQIKES